MDDGCRLYTTAVGEPTRTPIILLNSLGTETRLWDAQVGPFSQTWHLWRYDTRGHGLSDAPPGEYTIERLGRDVLKIMDDADIGRAHLCGISIGGLTALWLAAHAPDRVDRLVLANTAARIGNVALWDERISSVRTQGLASLVDGAMGRWFTAGFREREPETVQQIRETFVKMNTNGYIGCCAALRDADLRSEASCTEAPTLVISGAHDVATPPSDGRWLAEQISTAEYVELDAAHLSNVERATEFNHAVMEFLRVGNHG